MNNNSWVVAPTLDDIEEAARASHGIAFETPLLENIEVSQVLGGRLMIKAETAQRTGSFKFRGAYNRIRQMSDAERSRGVIAYSSGNHAQAVALVASLVGTQAHIVMPDDAPLTKMKRTRELGGHIITYEREVETREEVTQKIMAQHDYVLVPPNEDKRVLAGAGTVALELLRQAEVLGAMPDLILVPCGGGGLTAATAIVAKALAPSARVFGVEPELFDDTRRSLEAGERLANPKGRTTICDAIMTDIPGELTFSINRDLLGGILTVSDEEVCSAMQFAFDHFKIIIEPGAAVGLAAVLGKKIKFEGKTIAVIATGGNVDTDKYCSSLKSHQPK
jgi:threonine dehydratase